MFISNCIAETVQETAAIAETVQETAEGMKSSSLVFTVVFVVIGLYVLITGVLTMATGKFYGGAEKSFKKYTDESLLTCTREIGLGNVFVGLFIIALEATSSKYIPLVPGIIICAVLVIFAIVVQLPLNKKLVKKAQ
ncbi:MAG: hypothetical protein Q4G19_02530 [Clostridia bacterium]|nr:hypothetical protein [Clostridia bacterium]